MERRAERCTSIHNSGLRCNRDAEKWTDCHYFGHHAEAGDLGLLVWFKVDGYLFRRPLCGEWGWWNSFAMKTILCPPGCALRSLDTGEVTLGAQWREGQFDGLTMAKKEATERKIGETCCQVKGDAGM
jgi:hypothetical protein